MARVKHTLIILLVALFALPLILAYGLYWYGWRPGGTINHGELVQPARPIADALLRTLEGRDIRFHDLRRKWVLVYFGSSQCGEACERNLYKMRQVRLAQGKDADRILRMFLVTDARALDRLRPKLAEYPGMQVITGPAENVKTLAQQFALPAGSPLDGLERIYVVDPLGNLMMSYPAGADASGVRKDLVRLLKVSQIG
ncbi:MAG: SCO family protein [Acidiferrobacterales bacterium]|jgi:cytochrome oxidase Cu insertion factor (SCO1/SenC/PrrC family)